MHIEQEVFENDDDSFKTTCKVRSITQLLLPFSAISIAIRQVLIKSLQAMDGEDGDEKTIRAIVNMFVLNPLQSLKKCTAVFQLGTCVAIGEGSSFYSINRTSEYEPANMIQTVASHLLSSGAFVSPAKTEKAKRRPSPGELTISSTPKQIREEIPRRLTTEGSIDPPVSARTLQDAYPIFLSPVNSKGTSSAMEDVRTSLVFYYSGHY